MFEEKQTSEQGVSTVATQQRGTGGKDAKTEVGTQRRRYTNVSCQTSIDISFYKIYRARHGKSYIYEHNVPENHRTVVQASTEVF
jgi:hypothetical protein